MSVTKIQSLLEKVTDFDKDERFMAISDLQQQLRKDIKIDSFTEKRICDALLDRLEKDKSNDVQSICVNCLSELLQRCREEQVAAICDKLSSKIVQGDTDQLRDIYSIGLKTLMKDVPRQMGPVVTKHTIEWFMTGVKNSQLQLKGECLDLLTELLRAFGKHVAKMHADIMAIVLHQFEVTDKAHIRKRATHCLGALSVSLSNSMLQKLMEALLQRMKKQHGLVAYIQAIGTVSHNVGYRLGGFLGQLIPLLFQALGNVDDDDCVDDTHCDLRENCLNAFASFVMRCPREVEPFVPRIVEACLAFLCFDPNYDYDEEEGEDGAAGDAADDGDSMDDYEYDDGDDMYQYGGGADDIEDADDVSWRVRKTAVKVLSNLAKSRPYLLPAVFGKCSDALLSRFKEREETVRIEIIACFAQFLQVSVRLDAKALCLALPLSTAAGGGGGPALPAPSASTVSPAAAVPQLRRQPSVTSIVRSNVAKIVKTAVRHLTKNKDSVKTRMAIFQMLQELFLVLRAAAAQGGRSRSDDALGVNLPILVPQLVVALQPSSSNTAQLRLSAMGLLQLLLDQRAPALLQPFLAQLLPVLVACSGDDWYRLVSKALQTIVAFIRVLRPDPGTPTATPAGSGAAAAITLFDVKPFVQPLFQAILPRLRKRDIDHEIKERAIAAAALLVARLGNHLGGERLKLLKMLTMRLRNDMTRMAALRGIATIARSPFRFDKVAELSPQFAVLVGALVPFLKQQRRELKLAVLEALVAVVGCSSARLDAAHVALVTEAAELLQDSDLHVSHLALDLACALTDLGDRGSSTLAQVEKAFVPGLQRLLFSPLLQGPALTSVLALLQRLVKGRPTIVSSLLPKVLSSDFSSAEQAAASTIISNVGRAAAVLVLNGGRSDCETHVGGFIARIQRNMGGVAAAAAGKRAAGGTETQLLLRIVGEIGRKRDLSGHAALHQVILGCFATSHAEAVRSAAALALGSITVGSMDTYLPIILRALEAKDQSRDLYLILVALRAILAAHHTTAMTGTLVDLRGRVAEILPRLMGHCEDAEEGTRNMVAECLGRLARISPGAILPAMRDAAAAASEHRRTIAIMSIRFAISEKPHRASDGAIGGEAVAALALQDDRVRLERALQPLMPVFFKLLGDQSVGVLEATLVTLNAIAHHRPSLVQPLFPPASNSSSGEKKAESLWPLVFGHMKVKKELKRTVDLGPFKQKVDDGLPLRKAAFTCIDTMLTTMPVLVDVEGFVPYLKPGLGEKEADVKMLCHQILIKLCEDDYGSIVLGYLNELLGPLAKTIKKRASSDPSSFGAQDQRSRQLVFSAVRVVEVLSKTVDPRSNQSFADLWQFLATNQMTSEMLAKAGASTTTRSSSSHGGTGSGSRW